MILEGSPAADITRDLPRILMAYGLPLETVIEGMTRLGAKDEFFGHLPADKVALSLEELDKQLHPSVALEATK